MNKSSTQTQMEQNHQGIKLSKRGETFKEKHMGDKWRGREGLRTHRKSITGQLYLPSNVGQGEYASVCLPLASLLCTPWPQGTSDDIRRHMYRCLGASEWLARQHLKRCLRVSPILLVEIACNTQLLWSSAKIYVEHI